MDSTDKNVEVHNDDQAVIEIKKAEYKMELIWINILGLIAIHVSAIYGLYIGMLHAQLWTIIYMGFVAIVSTLGVQCGAHRLWCHRTYKAKLPLQLLLAFMHILAMQTDIYEWSRDHRVHHKYSETDADPHNAKRGFFFAHCGWLMCKKHPDVKEKGKSIDLSDLENDPVVMFEHKYHIPLCIIIWGILPTIIPWYFWGESLWNAFFLCVMYRYGLALNLTWCVNSASHLWGLKPYDKTINPVEASMRHLLMGEGFHNYHHAFPWDYSASEFGSLDVFNPGTAFIDVMAMFGLAYDLRKASNKVVKERQLKTGDITFVKNSSLYEITTGTISVLMLVLPFVLGFCLRNY